MSKSGLDKRIGDAQNRMTYRKSQTYDGLEVDKLVAQAVQEAQKQTISRIEKEIEGLKKKEVSEPEPDRYKYSIDWANEKKLTCKLCHKAPSGQIWCRRHSPKVRYTTRIYRPENDGYNQALDDVINIIRKNTDGKVFHSLKEVHDEYGISMEHRCPKCDPNPWDKVTHRKETK